MTQKCAYTNHFHFALFTQGQNHQKHSFFEHGAYSWGMEKEIWERDREDQKSENRHPAARKWAQTMAER